MTTNFSRVFIKSLVEPPLFVGPGSFKLFLIVWFGFLFVFFLQMSFNIFQASSLMQNQSRGERER